MPSAYDLHPVAISHHPTQRLEQGYAGLPPLDLASSSRDQRAAVNFFLDLVGLDISSPEAFVTSRFNSTTGGPALQFAAAMLDHDRHLRRDPESR